MWDWGAVQAVGTIFAIGVAIYVPWQQHENDLKRMRQQQREERLLRIESAAAIAINAMNKIEEAWKHTVQKPENTLGYIMEAYNRQEFEQAQAALHEINVADLPDWEMVRPILELRDLVIRAGSLVDLIGRAQSDPAAGDPDEGRDALAGVHDRAHAHTTSIEAAVNRMKDVVQRS